MQANHRVLANIYFCQMGGLHENLFRSTKIIKIGKQFNVMEKKQKKKKFISSGCVVQLIIYLDAND